MKRSLSILCVAAAVIGTSAPAAANAGADLRAANAVQGLLSHAGRSLIGLVCLMAGLALIRMMFSGRFERLPVLERMMGDGVRPKVQRKRFLTRVEQDTLAYIEAAFPQFRVHCQVSMGALSSPERYLDRKAAVSTHQLYSQKIVDFVLQERGGGRIVALVELDDATHRHRRDHARDVLTATAGYRTIRLSASHRPTLESVRETISYALS